MKNVSHEVLSLEVGFLFERLGERHVDCKAIPTWICISEKKNICGVVTLHRHDVSPCCQFFRIGDIQTEKTLYWS